MNDLSTFGFGEVQGKIEELTKKLAEAKVLANEIATTKIYVQDTRKKEIDDYMEELRNDFKKTFHHEPEGIYLVAEGQNGRCQIILSGRRDISSIRMDI
ncbi:hypothetical protein [Bacillus sp. Fil]|uniref:hypothetical protein n=1 Tax=Bacillus sp. Fil TaxID=3459567 RepID=UPI00403AA8E1